VKTAENRGENAGCPCEGRLETESSRGARSGVSPEGTERNGAGSLLAKVLDKANLNRAYKRVVDRLIQLAIAQILEPIFEPEFSDSSYGFRPGRSAHQAIRKTREYYDEGYRQVVDIDLAKYFDTINHDLLINMLREKIKDESLLSLIRKCLNSGVMLNGVHIPTYKGSTQGSPLSPLLSNVYLTKFDRLLESRGHKFVRYADDCNIYVRSNRAGNRVMSSCTRYLEGVLKLKVNQEKSAAGLATIP
jgi:group II intron reverse transcriptase/maturase